MKESYFKCKIFDSRDWCALFVKLKRPGCKVSNKNFSSINIFWNFKKQSKIQLDFYNSVAAIGVRYIKFLSPSWMLVIMQTRKCISNIYAYMNGGLRIITKPKNKKTVKDTNQTLPLWKVRMIGRKIFFWLLVKR